MTKLLVMDDDRMLREVTVRILQAEGYGVDQALNFGEACERVTQQDYAVVVADIKPSDEDGGGKVRTLKEIRPNLEVVVLTANGTLDFALETMRAGAADFLLKPCSALQLRETVAKTLSKRERSQANQMLSALNEMKDKFLTLVSHELRTPLTLIFGYLSLFLRQGGVLSREQLDLLDVIMKATRKLIQIVNNMQTVAQAEAGEMRLDLQPVESRALLADVLSEMRTVAVDRDLQLTLAAGEEVGPWSGDPLRLRQILIELVQNAIRNTPNGGEIVLGARCREGRVVLWVKDSGIGIPLNEQGKIFEPFYEVASIERHSSSSEFQGGGIGLGLSLVKAVVEAHLGTIRLEAAPDRGTLFELSFPMDLTPETLPRPKFSLAGQPGTDPSAASAV
jgi:signal transduction histidine kinase